MVNSATNGGLHLCAGSNTLDGTLVGDEETPINLQKAQMQALQAELPVETTAPRPPAQLLLSLRKTRPLSRSASPRSTTRSPILVAPEARPSNHASMQPAPHAAQENGKGLVSYCSQRYFVLSVLRVSNHRPFP